MSAQTGDSLTGRQIQKDRDVIHIEQGVAFEHPFDSSKAYANPFVDVTFDGVFECDGKSWVVPAFWIGGRRWAVRFAPPHIGEYSFTIRCSDPSNAITRRPALGIHVDAYRGRNELLKHGMLRIAGGKRHFEHLDGTPFLWLADTWWKCLAKRLPLSSFRQLTADRKDKGVSNILWIQESSL